MQPDPAVRPEYVAAFCEIVARIAAALEGTPRQSSPVRMYVAGGAAVYFYTAERVSEDIDATFSRRLALPEDLEVAYRDADGAARVLYFDRQYNDSFALLHEDAKEDSLPLALDGVDPAVLDVRLLSPVDLAVSKISRLSDQDRSDIVALARRGLIDARTVGQRAEEAVGGFVGDLGRIRDSIGIVVRILEDTAQSREMGISPPLRAPEAGRPAAGPGRWPSRS